jgi:hypothetical protein
MNFNVESKARLTYRDSASASWSLFEATRNEFPFGFSVFARLAKVFLSPPLRPTFVT